MYFYPRSPCGERQALLGVAGRDCDISIHALLAESDSVSLHSQPFPGGNFYPRSPCGERQCWQTLHSLTAKISIHALLAESDFPAERSCTLSAIFLSTLSLRRATGGLTISVSDERHFYPRSPCGERQLSCSISNRYVDISIHALLAESDPPFAYFFFCSEIFLSTLSLRRATHPLW